MPNVGFYGGTSFREIGPAADMRIFFNCVRLAATRLSTAKDDGLLTDRLYRRYLRLDELDPATTLVAQIQEIFADTQVNAVDWINLDWNKLSKLDLSLPNLGEIFDRYLIGAKDLISNARGFEKRFHIYKPVITIITDTPRFYVEKRRPLAEYDALEGDPMWLR